MSPRTARGGLSPQWVEPAWVEERWRDPSAPSRDSGELAFEAIADRGQTPALIRVELPGAHTVLAPQNRKLLAEPARNRLRQLRPLLPGDCFPFAAPHAADLCAYFVTGYITTLPELRQLGGRLLAEMQLPVEIPRQLRDLSLSSPEVRMCLADDQADYRRAEEIVRATWWWGEEERFDQPLLVVSARQRGVNVSFNSPVGLIDRALPKLRSQHPERELSLLALVPNGPKWQGYKVHYEGGARDIWWGITRDHLRPWARERGATVFELSADEKFPPFGVALAMPFAEAEQQLAELVDHLQQQRYWDAERGEWPDWMMLLAEPGEIEFRTACLPVRADSDGTAELFALRGTLSRD